MSSPGGSSSTGWLIGEFGSEIFENDIIDIESAVVSFGITNDVEHESMELDGEFFTSLGDN